MDYLDPKKQRRHGILLLIGYVFMAVGIVAATVLLVYQAYGFGLDKNGLVIQNGIVFFSSHPASARVYIDGKLYKNQTSTRASLPAGIYNITMARTGYQDWKRTIEINGGSVTYFDYPLLLPTNVQTTTVAPLTALPSLATQSPDRRWLVLSEPAVSGSFLIYDLKGAVKVNTPIALPIGLATKTTTSEQWQAVEWADDNQHLLVKHIYDDKAEFILLDRQNPEQSLNLNQTLSAAPTALTLNNKKYDQYYLYTETDRSLQTASLKAPAAAPLLKDVLTYKTYSDDMVLYFTDADAPSGKVHLRQLKSGRTTLLRSFTASSHYLLDQATYDGIPYVIASSADENKVYIYKDPAAQLARHPAQVIVPIQVLRVVSPDFESFSSTAQYIMAEHGNQLAVYDLQNKNGYDYILKTPIDNGLSHVAWMDGDRLAYTGAGKLQIMDYDATNVHSLGSNGPTTLPFFAQDYKNVYTLTALLAPLDR
jgi:hypothetical protein